MAVGLRLIGGLDQVGDFIPVAARYQPDPAKTAAYEPYYQVFRRLYRANKENFRLLNGGK